VIEPRIIGIVADTAWRFLPRDTHNEDAGILRVP
jgi:hypothetical protein